MNGTKRHPIRGFFAGLLAGVGVALVGIFTSQFALGTITPLIVIVVFVVIGVAWAMFGPTRQRGGSAPAAAGAASSSGGSSSA